MAGWLVLVVAYNTFTFQYSIVFTCFLMNIMVFYHVFLYILSVLGLGNRTLIGQWIHFFCIIGFALSFIKFLIVSTRTFAAIINPTVSAFSSALFSHRLVFTIRDILMWTTLHGRTKEGRPARTYIQQLCVNTGCGLEDLPGAMDDRQVARGGQEDPCW